MAAPSWLPSWKSTWPDLVSLWKDHIPQEFPRYLYAKAGEAWLDLQAAGESLSMVRQALEWVLKTHFPHLDADGQFLSRWEADYGISPRASVAERWGDLIAKAREQGTLTLARAKNAVAVAFGTYLGSTLSVAYPNPTEFYGVDKVTPDTAQQWAELLFQMHFYPTNEDVEPDQTAFSRIASRVAPAVDSWTCGMTRYAKYADVGDEDQSYGGYGVSVYDDI